MIHNCLITGVGGQGTVLMARLIGEAALSRGLDVRGSETIGMAQRGGSVASHLRMGDGGPIHSPLIPPDEAGLILALEPGEALRVLPFLAPQGRLVVLDRGVSPVGVSPEAPAYDPAAMIARLRQAVPGDRLAVVNGGDLIARCGSARTLNVALLGFALARGLLPFTPGDLLAALEARIPPRYLPLNRRALEVGAG